MPDAPASTIVIRPATPADAPAMGRLGALLVRTHHDFDPQRFIAAGERTAEGYGSYLGRQLRESDVIARIGGDEFAILWISRTPLASEGLHSRLKAGLDAHTFAESRPYRLSLSIGFSHYPGGFEESLADMLFATDQRMYADKRTGTSRR